MKRSANGNCFGPLGLAAMLLLLLLPTTGRIWQAVAAGADRAAAHHVMQAVGAAHLDVQGGKQPLPPPPGSADCDYCPLLAAPVPSLQAMRVPPAQPGSRLSYAATPAPRRAWLHPNGLGSRGPPSQG